MLVLDSGGLSRLSQRTSRAAALIDALRAENLWPPVVPTMVLAESTTGAARTDANINRLLKSCDVEPLVAERTARRGGDPEGACPHRIGRRCVARCARGAGRHSPDRRRRGPPSTGRSRRWSVDRARVARSIATEQDSSGRADHEAGVPERAIRTPACNRRTHPQAAFGRLLRPLSGTGGTCRPTARSRQHSRERTVATASLARSRIHHTDGIDPAIHSGPPWIGASRSPASRPAEIGADTVPFDMGTARRFGHCAGDLGESAGAAAGLGRQRLTAVPRSQKPYALLHESDLGKFLLTSDSVLASTSGSSMTSWIPTAA